MKLTRDQLKAIESIDKPTAIIAGAGSGKTEVLTERLRFILSQKKCDLSQILTLTFTEKAAQEMKRRISKNLDPEAKKELPWSAIGTFHGFCLNILKEHAPLLGLSSLLSVWDEHTAKLAIHRHTRATLLEELEKKNDGALLLVEEIEFRNTLALFEELLQFRWHWENLQKQEARGKRRENREKQLWEATTFLYRQILQNYDEEKNLRQAVDFQDLEILTLRLFHENKDILKNCQGRFRHILIDEAQDLNDLQQELIQLLFDPKKNCLCVVGDPKQSIYRFRGANVEGFKKMVVAILKAGGVKIDLNENFRSRPALLEGVNKTFSHLFDPEENTQLLPTREESEGSGIVVLPVEGEFSATEERRKKEAQTIADHIRAEVSQNSSTYGDFALLFQSLSDVHLYEEAFKEQNIPYRVFGGRGFLKAQEVLDSLFILRVLANPQDRLSLIGLMRSPFLGLADTKITQLCLDHPLTLPSPSRGEGEREENLWKAVLKLDEATWLKKIAEEKEKLSSAQILEQAIFQTHYDVLLNQLDSSGAKLANIEQLITLIRELETKEGMSPEELVRFFETLKEKRSPLAQAPAVDTVSSPACQMMTVHQAKGLEFPVVILPDLSRLKPPGNHRYLFSRREGLGFYLREEGSPFGDWLPSEMVTTLGEKEKFHDLNERKRLLYVAMTRAKEKLVLALPEKVSRAGPWYGWIKETVSNCDKVTHGDATACHCEKRSDEAIPLGQLDCFGLRPRNDTIKIPYYTVTDLENKMLNSERRTWNVERRTKAGLSGADIGNLVHAALKEMDIDIKTHALNLALRATPEELKEVSDLLSRFLKGPLAPRNWKGEHELPFRLKFQNAVVTGMIDYLFETDQGWVICDFKTDARFHPEQYKLQMDIYALALSRAKSKPVIQTELLFLKGNKSHIEPCTPERLRRTEENLVDLLKTIR